MKVGVIPTLKTIKQTVSYLFKVSKGMFIIILVITSISGVFTAGKLILWKAFIDEISKIFLGNFVITNQLIIIISIHLGISLIQVVINQVKIYITNIFTRYLNKDITEKTLEKVEKLNMIQFDDSECYNIIKKVNDESLGRSMNLMNTLINIILSFSTLISTILVVYSFSKIAIFICLVSSIPVFIVNKRVMDHWFKVFNTRFEKIRFANHLKNICIRYDNIKELKIYNTNKFLREKIINIYDEVISEDKKIRFKFLIELSTIKILDEFITYFVKGLVVYISFIKKITIGSLVVYIEAIDMLKNSTNSILSMFTQAYEDSLYMQNFFTLLDIETYERVNMLKFNMKFNNIQFKNVSFKYTNTKNYAIKNFSYTFSTNKTYGLVGLNGSGKTTLLKILLGLYEVEEGEIRIDGVDLKLLDKRSYHKYISAVFQDFIKYPLDLKTNITVADYTKKYSKKKIQKVAKFTGADEFIEKLPDKYDTLLQKEWMDSVDLSLGQWQKIAICRAALKQSVILILDEPTASIDALTEYNMFNNFKQLKRNKCCILVTHRLSNIKIADEILVLDNGELVESGNHSDLIKNNCLYKKLFNMQAEAYETEEQIERVERRV